MTAPNEGIREIERKYRKRRHRKMLKQLPEKLVLFLTCVCTALMIWMQTQPEHTAPSAGMLYVYILDVGQGDAVLLQTDTHAVLIDGGEAEQGIRLVQMLHALGIERLDCVINSHPHSDHIGGLQTVLAQIPADTLYLADIPDGMLPDTANLRETEAAAAEQHTEIRVPACYEAFSMGCAELEFLSVENGSFDGLNDCSLGCRVTCGTYSFFFAGDLETAGERAFLDAGLVSPVTVLKASHHGSNTSSSEAFLAAARPAYTVISAGALNDYGHPATQCLTRLAEIGSSIYRTDLDGTVLFTTDGTAMEICTHYRFF